jgi:CBS domain-containing protein/mannitol/fructose-specific phosphotransferase system IIA component (Ntr-type)
MIRTRLLRRDHIVVPLECETLAAAITELIAAFVRSGAVADRAAVTGSIDADTIRSTVAINPRIVLPHYRTDAVREPVLAIGVTPAPLPPREEGGEGARIVALVLAPVDAATLYLRAVSGLAGALRKAAVLELLLAATGPDDVMAIDELAALQVEPSVLARDIMVRTDAARPDDTLRVAVETMARNDAGGLPVVGDKEEILGVVTEADVLRGLLQSRPRQASDEHTGLMPPLRVRDVMERSVMCIPDGADLDDIANLLISKDAELFPVVAEGRLIGLVRRVDILRKLYGR